MYAESGENSRFLIALLDRRRSLLPHGSDIQADQCARANTAGSRRRAPMIANDGISEMEYLGVIARKIRAALVKKHSLDSHFARADIQRHGELSEEFSARSLPSCIPRIASLLPSARLSV